MNWPLLAGSLAAMLALSGIAAWLKLGGGPLTQADALTAAGDMLPGFAPEAALLGSDGGAALVRGGEGRIGLVKRHGAQAAVREVARPLALRETGAGTLVDSTDLMFGAVILEGRSMTEVEAFASPIR